MHRLRNTFTRSRTPTGAEMKTQSSLEVPKQVRSASFDEIQLEAQRSFPQRSMSTTAAATERSPTPGTGTAGVGNLLLQVPQTTPGQRSRSFDLAGSASDEGSAVAAAFLDVPKRFQRRKSSSKTPPPCIHCLYLEEYRRLFGVEQRLYYDSEEYQAYLDYTSSSSGSDGDGDDGGAGGAKGGCGGLGAGVGDGRGGNEVTQRGNDNGDNDVDDNAYYYDDDDDEDDEDEDDEDADGDDDRDERDAVLDVVEADIDEPDEDTLNRKQRQQQATLGLDAPAYDYSTLFQRVSPRRRLRVDCGSATLLTSPPVASPCLITLTLSPTQPDDERSDDPGGCVFGGDDPSLGVRYGEIALMLPDRATECTSTSTSTSTATSTVEMAASDQAAESDEPPPPPSRTRRRSISRQEAIIVEPTGSSLENVSGGADSRPTTPPTASPPLTCQPPWPQRDRAASLGPLGSSSTSSPPPLPPYPCHQPPAPPVPPRPRQLAAAGAPLASPPPVPSTGQPPAADFVRDIYLQVPDLKRDRAASVDSCFAKVPGAKTEELQPPPAGTLHLLAVPTSAGGGGGGAVRSRSVDIVLPTEEQARYKALALAGPSGTGTAATGTVPASGATGGHLAAARGIHTYTRRINIIYSICLWVGDPHGRQIRCTPDWSENAVSGDHLWVPTSVSGDCCYVGDNDCTRHGPRMKCSACKIVSHASCISVVMERSQLQCKPTFRDVGVRQYREQTKTTHHWVHRRSEKGKCKQCGKSLQAKLTFSSKEIVALSCAWCKASYHNKEACFSPERIGEECTLGPHRSIVVPPSWIVKLPRKGNFKSSLRKTPQKKKKSGKKVSVPREPRTFVIKPIPTANITPVLVFINPKSGGNQGSKLLQKFQWLLNPRQVFDLTQGGPRMGLELFRKVPQLRVLACGGDGTVGWVLSVLDQINFVPPPAVGVLPLGTGNDLARALGWGGGYTDEPIGKILANIGNSDTVLLDRWNLKVEPNTSVPDADDGKDNLPLNVVNNYFSLGVDAHIALEFHEAREAHPEKFNSRLRNKMFYGQAGGKDLLKRKWKGLAEFVTLECDGKDLTPKLKEHKVHAIVFLNIPSYGGGTHPWNKSGGQFEPATDDGMIEVVGLTTYQLPLLQAGGHGTCITQCRSARIVTSKTIPMQVDGEACKLKPSSIELTLLNKAVMLAKKKPGRANVPQEKLESLNISLLKIMMADYEQHHYDKDLLRQSAVMLGNLEVPVTDLEQVRVLINKYCSEQPDSPKLSPDWCFIDSCTAERFFRVDRAQENLHFITDIATDCVFVLDQESPTLPQTPEDDHRRLGAPGPTVGSVESGESIPPPSPQATGKLLDRSLSGPAGDIPSRKSSQGSHGSFQEADGAAQSRAPGTPVTHDSVGNGQSLDQMVNFKSFHERLFGLNEDAFGFR
ncbi:eye-specific diacylglycerol kinase [Anopheles nili]|uniref:eye-specific diacylglycerol kinase n=1 Tax=Anopheles nili TaxID=185578 RepID=UPI00237BE6B3|nr:eye-specific diacylglycerol kinase [Anopheles nili]